jgi:hypothetical protein
VAKMADGGACLSGDTLRGVDVLDPKSDTDCPGDLASGIAQPVPSLLLAPVVRKGDRAQSDNVVELPPGSGRIELRLPLDRDRIPPIKFCFNSWITVRCFQWDASYPYASLGRSQNYGFPLIRQGLNLAGTRLFCRRRRGIAKPTWTATRSVWS